MDYNNKSIIVIRTKKGAKIFSGNHNNREVMFPSQAKFKVLSKQKQNPVKTQSKQTIASVMEWDKFLSKITVNDATENT